MAVASPSPLASSVQKTNGAKLSRLLIDGGTTVLRNVFDGYHPPANLAADLTANNVTLYNLKRRKVLHQPQWDLLFPTSGVPPDSKTFDITLLFLLLTNICGLAPPPSGWHKPPPSSDTSLEANLARVKWYRNELYGHVTSTGVQTAVFNVKWLEISAVLVALGLNPTEVARLKSAPCGEDYISAVVEWVKSDEEIKSQLKEVLQTQQEARQIQEEDHRTLQDTQKATEDVRQMLQDTHKTVEDVMQVHQDTNRFVKTVLKTQQEVRQSQLEDFKTLQDNKAMLSEVHQTQTKTQETVESVKTSQAERFKAVEADLQEIKQSVGEKNKKSQEDEVLQNLAKSEFKGDIEYHVERFQEGTREWVFTKVQDWLDDRSSHNRVMVISANAGMGKSVISAVVCKRMQEAGRLSGSHFCQHNNARYRNPQLMLQSLACHLCHTSPEYRQALVKQLSRNLGEDLNNMGVEELFALLFKEPLSTVADPGRNMLMVIDGLDESEYQERNELLDVIANHFCKLPCWIRFLCTTRPERDIAEALKQLKPFQLKPNKKENVQDIKLFLEQKTQYMMKPENNGTIVKKLVEKCEGLMLYAFFLASFIEENVLILEQEDLDGSLPLAISSVYHSYFKRLENELKKELGVKEENFLNLLCAVTASREPLPIEFVSKVLVPSSNSPTARRKVLKAISSVSSLLPIRDGCLHVIHKSAIDWLTDTSYYGEHEFTMDQKEGDRILASLCKSELDNHKQKGVHGTQLNPTEKYALQHGVRHMLQLDDNLRPGGQSLEECVQRYVIDLELLYAKLCLSNSLVVKDIFRLQRQEISQGLSEDIKDLLSTLRLLLRKHFIAISNNPHTFFQVVVNEGGTVLSSVALNLLQNKYPEIPYMVFVHKLTQQGAVVVSFQCSSKVACLDVSPQLDYMVCECKDGTIQLWSLHTGKLVWTRPVIVSKRKFDTRTAFKMKSFSSCVRSFYRSVVFHPTAHVVLPGVLSQAYTFDGDLKPFFPESSCRFTVCSISGDKTKMLTDCPDDAKCIIMWSLENGSEITRSTRNEDVFSFAWSRDGKLLAISLSRCICIVDVMDGFRTLGETVTSEVCGMIKFSPDGQSLFCLGNDVIHGRFFFRLKINMAEAPSLTSYRARSFEWEVKSQSETGFLLGDPISSDGYEFLFVLNKQTVLRGSPYSSFIDMLNINELHKTEREATHTRISNIVFSLSGETVDVVSDAGKQTVSAWDVSSGVLIAQKSSQTDNHNLLLAVKEGVLLTASGILELWKYDLSKGVRKWTSKNVITRMIPISEERVACETKHKVTILDTTSGEIVSTIPISHGDLLTCNSKCQLLTYSSHSLQLLDGETTLWRNEIQFLFHSPVGMFSLSGQFVIICETGGRFSFRGEMYVVDALSGKFLHVLCDVSEPFDCRFISDEECVISSKAVSGGSCIKLFNVKSGDLLNVINLERTVYCLAACPRKRLLAIDQSDSEHGFKLIQVHLPQDKDSRKSKWALNAGDHKNMQDGEEKNSHHDDNDIDDDDADDGDGGGGLVEGLA